MIRINRSELVIGQRQRREIELSKLALLRQSILARGLLHPPIVSFGLDRKYHLVAGERRLRALDAISDAKEFFMCDGETFLPGEIPVTRLTDLSPADLFDAELEENILREDLDWQDRIRAIAASHEMRKAERPEQTLTDTAREIVAAGATASVAGLAQRIREAEIIAPHLADPAIAKARNSS